LKQCIQCQTQLPDDARFCLQCGARQDSSPITVESDGATAQDGGVAARAGGVAIGGSIHGGVIIGERPQDPTDQRRA
jgi:hypothetical protein